MGDEEDERFSTRQGLFGWKGFGKDKSNQTTILTVSLIVNFLLVLYAVSTLGARDASGQFRFSEESITTDYYVLSGVTVLACAIGAALTKYDDFGTRWAARFFCCGIPALFVVLIPLVAGK
ncbi:MAG: hypothetical protein MPJ78_13270 [Hyphomicrobiaceae bacterium]|nr:hypothetical protein [Hyphomicrobiaceae bacterium]